MTHPLINDLQEHTDEELQRKLHNLTNKYYMTHNPSVKYQMQLVIDDLQIELARRVATRQVEQSEELKELDGLININ